VFPAARVVGAIRQAPRFLALLSLAIAGLPAAPAIAQKGKGKTEIEKEEKNAHKRDYKAIQATFLEPYAKAPDPMSGFVLESHVPVANLPEMTGLLNEIAQLLLLQWNGPRPDVRVVLNADPTPSAFAYGAGLITISTGFLDTLPSIDAVAAVLAHEIAHLLLRHDDKRRETAKTLGMVAGLASSAAVYGEVGSTAKQTKGNSKGQNKGQKLSVDVQMTPAIRNRLVTGYAVDAILTDSFLPMAKAKQEFEADRLAVDLLVRSPFSADGQAETFLMLAEAEARAGTRISRASDLVGGLAAQLLYGNAGGRSDLANSGRALGAVAAGAVAKSLITAVGKKTDGEADPDKRRQAYLEYARVYGGEYPLADAAQPQVKAMAQRFQATRSAPGWKSAQSSIQASWKMLAAAEAVAEVERAKAAGQSQIVAAPPPLPLPASIPQHPQVPMSYRARALAALFQGQAAETVKSLEAGSKLPNFPLRGYRDLAEAQYLRKNIAGLSATIGEATRVTGRDLWMLDFKVGAAVLGRRPEEAEVLAARCLKEGEAEFYASCERMLGYPAACAPRTEAGKIAFEDARRAKGLAAAVQVQRAAMGEAGGPACT
jgi:Zn-dependent protease with chaperone function